MRCVLLALLLLLSTASVAVEEDLSARFETISDLESVPDGVVTALAQDQSGFLWIGSTRGLIRYDGYVFKRFVHQRDDPGSLGGNLIRALLPTADGRLWVGTDADGLSMYDPRSERFVVYRHDPERPDSLPRGAIMALALGRDGRLWVGSRGGGLAELDPGTGRSVNHRAGASGELAPREDFIHALHVDGDGTLWIGTRAGLRQLGARASVVQPVLSSALANEGVNAEVVYSLVEPGDGLLWVGTQSGRLLLVDPRTLAVQHPQIETGTAPGTLDTVSAMARLGTGEVWLGRSSGIEVREMGSGRLLRRMRHDPARPTGLGGNEVRALLEDRSGLLWVGGFGGGVQWHDPTNRWARVLRGRDGFGGVFSQPDIASVLERSNGEIWLGTRGHGVAILDASLNLVGGLAPQNQSGEGLNVGWITALAEADDGRIWLGSRDGLRAYAPDSGRFERLGVDEGLHNLSIRRLFQDSRDNLWIGTGDGLFLLPSGARRIDRLEQDAGQPLVGEFNAFDEDSAGNLWIGASTGLFRRAPGETNVQRIDNQAQPGLAHPSVVGLLVDEQDRLWVDTVEGLFVLRDPRPPWAFESISQPLGVSGDFGANLLQDHQGRIWTHRHHYDPTTRRIHSFSEDDGVDFGTGWFRAYLRSRDGRLLFGGSRGLLVVQPDNYRPWIYQPSVQLTELRVGDQRRPPAAVAEGLELHPGQRSVTVEFAALDFSGPQRLRYAYRLTGVDDDWVPADAGQRVAAYRNLPPGSYRLQIRGSNRSGAWSPQQIDLPVSVRPAWWQTRSFALLAVLAGVLLAAFAMRLRVAFLRQQAIALEALVKRRTEELSQAKAHAEHALSDLQRAKDQLVEAEKMASLGALVAGVAHEINTPLGIAVTAASHLRDISTQAQARLAEGQMTKGELRQWQQSVAEGNGLILGNLERAGRLVSSFKRVAVDQSSEERRHFELRGFLEEIRTALQPGFRRTRFALDIDCPDGIELDTYPGALFQIFTNLVNNALIHAFEGRDAGRMAIRAHIVDGELELRFQDDGPGMPADVAARAFDPFFTTRRSAGGSGLGLHLVYNLVTQLLLGRIELHTAPGKGAEFVIHIPLRAQGG
jgi:ligand-binding sensor domain-containing protein/signal transduction histidine kinase